MASGKGNGECFQVNLEVLLEKAALVGLFGNVCLQRTVLLRTGLAKATIPVGTIRQHGGYWQVCELLTLCNQHLSTANILDIARRHREGRYQLAFPLDSSGRLVAPKNAYCRSCNHGKSHGHA